jgi:hypothetical protein
MIAALARAFDRFRGSGDAAVTIPSMDGAFRPNVGLETATSILELSAPDNLTYDGRRVLLSSGCKLLELKGRPPTTAEAIAEYAHPITALDAHVNGMIAVGLASGEIVLVGGNTLNPRLNSVGDRPSRCPTALRFLDADTLIVCLGSQHNDPTGWARDLLENNSSGSIWSVDLRNGNARCLADRLAWPSGVVTSKRSHTVGVEAWRHQLVQIADDRRHSLLTEIPGYPGRISPAGNGGYWLSVFAPRSQLLEFVLREPGFRGRMMREVESQFWVAPSLHAARDYREPLQAGAIKQLGELKPWAPSRSYGLVVHLDEDFQAVRSFHSRADGKRHGITSCVEAEGRVLVTSKGGDVVLALRLEESRG